MIRRSLNLGIAAGLTGSLLLIAPVMQWFVLPAAGPASQPDAAGGTRTIAFMLMSGMGSMILFVAPIIAAFHRSACPWWDNLFSAARTALTETLLLLLLVILPANAASVAIGIHTHTPAVWDQEILRQALQRLTAEVVLGQYDIVFQSLVLALVFSAALGVLSGLRGRRRGMAPAAAPGSPDLLAVLDNPRARRGLWAGNEDDLRLAVQLGTLYGVIIALFGFVLSYRTLNDQMAGSNIDLSMFAPRADMAARLAGMIAVPVIIPLVFVAGGLPVLLLKHPTSRMGARVRTAIVAALVSSVIGMFGITGALYLLAALGPAASAMTAANAGVPAPRFSPAELLTQVIALTLVAPPIVGATFAFVWTAWLGLQGLGYGLIVPLFIQRPVDRAAKHAAALWQAKVAGPLPAIYGITANDGDALEVLTHVTLDLRKHQPDAARLCAAYHLLAGRPERAEDALETIGALLARHPEWRWSAEITALHGLILASLRARSISNVLDCEPIADEHTGSLPPGIAHLSRHLSDGLRELKKLEKVPDAQAKLIFLSNALEELHEAEHTQERNHAGAHLPEEGAMERVFNNWQSLILIAIKDLKGRARLTAELGSHKLTYAPRTGVCITVANGGLNVAESVLLRIESGDGYEIVEGREQTIELLPPGEERMLDFVLALPPRAPGGPAAGRRVRLTWRLIYDDAVDERRELAFADVLEFVEEDQPFQRIFPIPYVTGTPLQTGHLFVGRDDVFTFVREHLLGVYQNNVIVLHGQRRTGKTSILYRLKDVLADTHAGVLIDMQGKAARGTADFLYAIADDIAYALESGGIVVELPPRQEFAESPEFYFKSRFLRGVIGQLGRRNLLLMFDEFEELQKRVDDGKLEAGIFSTLRNLMQHEPRVNFVFAGTHKLEELGADYWSTLFNIASYKKITFLAPGEVRRLVTEPVAPFGLEYDPLAVDMIIRVAAGHPYFTQVICHELVAYHNETRRNYLTITEIDFALERIVERGEAHFKYIWAESLPVERRVLLALAYLLNDQEVATPDEVEEALVRTGFSAPDGALAEALHALEARDILMRSAAAGNIGAPDLYRFKIDLIRRWIDRARPVAETA
jgi:hypothetical protein